MNDMDSCPKCGVSLCHEDCGAHHDGPSTHARIVALETALAERDDLIDYIVTNSLGGWGGRTVDEIDRWRKSRAAKPKPAREQLAVGERELLAAHEARISELETLLREVNTVLLRVLSDYVDERETETQSLVQRATDKVYIALNG